MKKKTHSFFEKVSVHAFIHSPRTLAAFVLLVVSPILTMAVVQQRQDIRQRAQTAPTPPPVSIDIVDFSFNPGTRTVPVGTRITWTNRSTNGVPHTSSSDVTSGSNAWDSGFMNPGATFSRTFNTAGTFTYHCNVHGAALMSGTIIVVAQTPPTLTPTPTPTRTPTPTPTRILTPTPTRTPTPTFGPGPGTPPFVCLGSCPTNTPTVTPTTTITPTPSPTKIPSPTPTRTPTPTPSPTLIVTASPTPNLATTLTPTPDLATTETPTPGPMSPTPTLDPCQADTAIASDNSKKKSNNGFKAFFDAIFEFIIKLFRQIIALLTGQKYNPPPPPAPTPTPTAYVQPTVGTSQPTSPVVQPTGGRIPTNPPAPTVYDTPPFRVYDPTKGPNPTAHPTATLTPTPLLIPTATPTLRPNAPTLTPTPVILPTATTIPDPEESAAPPPPCDTPTPQPSDEPGTPTPTIEVSMPMPSISPSDMISVADLKYIPGNEPLKEFNIVAGVTGNNWTYNGTVPGPELRVKEGDHVRINITNNLPHDGEDIHNTTIHSHGIVLPAAEDGIPGITQNAVKPEETFSYDYVPDNPPGTYWYHSHQFGATQVTKGLFGALIIEPKNPKVTYDRDYVIAYRNVDTPSTTHLDALPGERVRLRFLDAREPDFTGAPIKTAIVGVPFKVLSLDAVDINQPEEIESQLLVMDLSQRMDVEFTMPASGSALIAEKEGLQTITIGDGITPIPGNLNTLPDFNFLTYGKPGPNKFMPKTTFDQTFTMTIGPDLSINGKFFPNVPDFVVKKGQLNKIKFVNNSSMWHPMHLHGQFYTVLSVNGVPSTGSPIIRDALIVPPGETAEIAVFAENPGMWMFHCHIYAHAGVGLMMMNTFEGVFTPYSIAPGSGNHPQ